MLSRSWSIPITVLLVLLLSAGCIHPSGTNGVPPTPPTVVTPLPLTQAPGTSCLTTPGPLQTLPAYEDVSVTIDRNTITDDPTITARFDGGKGLGMVQRMTVTVIRSDCVTEQEFRNAPKMGDSITLMGTTGNDRVIVVLVMTSGDQYTVIDAIYPFPVRM
ncbi:hypothetical protein [Methanoregula sp.]|uniref:hypothetical protein n=1 Tax=Methanoregula sp. TaxID=2052170 RepID=UPI00262BF029|nr:hypothetical protein [Methanoregula sp.]MDD5142579.1 hypothetical protein [Methanoregula sp.]